MKRQSLHLAALLVASALRCAAQNAEDANTVVLDATGVKNLRIETVVAEPITFEESFFSLGRIEARPEKTAAVSSRIPGRVVHLGAVTGDSVKAGQEIVRVESRQPGNPPPTVPLSSPIDGMVTHLDSRLGDPVEPDRALMEIMDLAEVFAIARVPEASAGRLQPGTVATIRIPAVPDTPFTGTLLRLGTAADRESGTIDAVFVLKNPDDKLRPGMRAEFSIVTGRREDVVGIPRSALQGEPSNRFVYVKHFDLPNAFVKTPVVVGQTNDRFVEIVSGLFPADEVVVRGAYSLAFAGGGSISLKEALDAAHGHEHNADGSEITAEQKAGKSASPHDDHDHAHGEGTESANVFWKVMSGVLFVALVAAIFWKRK